jgi:peptide/nickel transport system substrate-binding protein
MMRNIRLSIVSVTLLFSTLLLGAASAQGDQLVVGFQGGAVTLDPHMRAETTTISWQLHTYESLTYLERDGSVLPKLATEWEAEDENTWLVTLREDVKWQDGSDFTADDAAYALERALNHPGSEMKQYITAISSVEAVDTLTIRIHTASPDPLMPLHLSQVRIVNEAFTEEMGDNGMTSQAMGTGPYRVVSYSNEENVVLERFDGYWGELPSFERVQLVNIPNGSTRIAALLSGEIDVAEKILPQDFPRLERDENTYITQIPGNRVIYLTMDFRCSDACPGSNLEGGANPFTDPLVRRAVYHAIDVDTIVERIMGGAAAPATQLIAPATTYYDERIERYAYDPEEAQRLLTEAGYPDGFSVRLDAPNDRYLNDALVAQAVGGLLGNVGIQVEVNATPKAVFFPQIDGGEFLMYLAGWSSSDVVSTYNAQIHTKDDEAGYGFANRNGYSSSEVDTLVQQVNVEFDEARRIELIHGINQQALIEDVVWVPLHVENVIAGVREGVVFEAHPSEYLLAWEMSGE